MQQISNSNTLNENNTSKTIPGINQYLEEQRFLKKIRASAESRKIPIIDDQTGRFLELACKMLEPKKILEIGCGTGYSTYFLLKYILPELTIAESIIQENNSVKTQFSYTGIDLNKERINEACFYVGDLIGKSILPACGGSRQKNIVGSSSICYDIGFIHGDAIKVLKSIDEKFDMIFIDAAKFQYPLYLEAVSKKLKDGCTIIADNIFYCGKIFREEVLKHDANSLAGLKEYIDTVTAKDCFKTSFFDIGDGLAISIYSN